MVTPPAPRADDTPVRDRLAALAARGVDWSDWPLPAVGARPAAVLILFGVLDHLPARHRATAVPADLDVLLVGRAESLRHHPGQISFPGGRVDPGDPGPHGAAVREAVEETGLDPAGVEVLGALGELSLPVSDYRVTPVLAWWDVPSEVAAVDHAESSHVFRAPVADLLDPANRATTELRRGTTVHRGPAFEVAGQVVWGFTAMVLDRLFDELGWTEPWDAARTVPVPLRPPR